MYVLELGEKVSIELDATTRLGHPEQFGAHGADAAGLGPLGFDLECGLPVDTEKHTISTATMPWYVGPEASVTFSREVNVLSAGAYEGYRF